MYNLSIRKWTIVQVCEKIYRRIFWEFSKFSRNSRIFKNIFKNFKHFSNFRNYFKFFEFFRIFRIFQNFLNFCEFLHKIQGCTTNSRSGQPLEFFSPVMAVKTPGLKLCWARSLGRLDHQSRHFVLLLFFNYYV